MSECCERCLRRAFLLGRLGAHIERAARDRARGRAPELLALGDEPLVRAVGGRRTGEILAAHREADADELRRRVSRAELWSVCSHSPGYPAALRDLGAEAPAALFGRGPVGELRELEPDAGVTVVGARRATPYGLGVAEDLARMLAKAGLAVVSGMANGVDSRAHSGALDAEGSTIAVLGGGADVPYPRRQTRLYRRIVDAGGLVLSEMPPGAASFRWSFPARNRIMAALARVTVVVEAAGRSGSLITATMALDLGREVGAVPGPVGAWMSSGTNQLLVDGAAPIRDAQDVLDRLLGPGRRRVRELGPELESPLVAVLDQVERGRATCDEIAVASGMQPNAVAAALTRLELLGYLDSDATGRHVRTPLRRPDSR